MTKWEIIIHCEDEQVGEPIECEHWGIFSRLAAVRDAIPVHWHADAHPIIPEDAK